ncbi:hypothetical protein [Catellatospora tritici]|uniref:hypothetical protein n=1 Tax=Catellatospora tritici TaxID=2851566 RepID=UPI001C2D8DBB|nr:hypothetical protein [Catellatospora tritici]MBV1852887.1 hypothetical protein [Catellatospora tritici]
MSELVPDYTVPADPDARPRTVTAAAWLLAGVGGAYLIDAGMLVAGAGSYPDRVAQALRESGVDQKVGELLHSFALGVAIMAIVLTVVAAVVMLVLSVLVRGRSRTGRVFAWIAGGLALMCGLCAAAASGTPAFSGIGYVNAWSNTGSGMRQFSQRLPDGYPPYYRIAATVLGILSLMALIAVIILLARRESNAWFRRPVVVGVHPGRPLPAPAAPTAAPVAAAPSPEQAAAAQAAPRQRTIEEIEDALAALDSARRRGDLAESDYMAQVAGLRAELRELD